MNPDESFDNSTYADQIHMAERELASFIGAVTEVFGPEQARLSADDWLDESELMDSPPRSTSRDWRAVTVAASARLASRLTVARDHRALAPSTDTKVSPILSSNCFAPALLVRCVDRSGCNRKCARRKIRHVRTADFSLPKHIEWRNHHETLHVCLGRSCNNGQPCHPHRACPRPRGWATRPALRD